MQQLKLFLAAVAIAFAVNASAQENKLFNHLSIGYTLGTDGLIGFDVASPIGNYVAVRAGYTFMPKFKADVDVNYKVNGTPYKANIEGKLNMGNFKLLFDVYPFKEKSFHFTAGAYMGTSKLIKADSKKPLEGVAPGAQVQIGNKAENMFGTDAEGHVHGRTSVNSFKPYIGIGFGRVVSNKFCNVSCDLGVMIWGKPKVEMYDYHYSAATPTPWKELKKSDFNKDTDKDAYDAFKIADKLSVWPVLNIRVGFRAF